MSCAGLPASYFIVPDPLLVGAANVLSVTSEQGPYPGAAAAEDGNRGRLLPVQSGRLTADAEDVGYRILSAGGVGTAEFLWRRLSETSSDWYGADDPQRFEEQHHPSAMGGGAITDPAGRNTAVVYSGLTRNILLFAVPSTGGGTDTVTVARRDVDNTRYDEWTASTFVLDNPVETSTRANLAGVELADGRILLVVRRAQGVSHDFDAYQSTDGGVSWAISSRGIIEHGSGPAALTTQTTDSQIRLARSGEHLRLAWVEGGATIHSLHSSDRGATWTLTGDAIAVSDSGAVDDPHCYDLCDLDGQGYFQLALSSGVNTWVGAYYARGAAVFAIVTVPFSADFGGIVYQIISVRTPSLLYVFVLYDTGASDLQWTFRRIDPALASVTLITEYDGTTTGMSKHRSRMEYAPGRTQVAWTGDGLIFWGGSRDQAGTYNAQTEGQAWYWGGWSKRSIGVYPPSSTAFSGSNEPIWRDLWHCGLGFPSENASSTWTETLAGGGTKISSREYLELIGSGVGDVVKYEETVGVGWLVNSCFYWRVRLDIGDGSATVGNIVTSIEAEVGAVASIQISVRHAPGSLILIDNLGGGATLATLAVPGLDSGPTGAFTEVRLWMSYVSASPRVQLIALDNTTGAWLVSPVVVPAQNTATPAVAGTIQFGHVGQTQATQMRSWWRELGWRDEVTSQQGGPNDDPTPTGQANPSGLFGWPTAAAMPTAIDEGLQVVWAGSGAVRGDAFSGPVQHQHPIEAATLGSPRLDWRSVVASGAIPTSTIILDADPTHGIARWEHDAIGLFGCNTEKALVDYDNNIAFSSPTTAETVDATAFGAAVFTVASVAGAVLRISGVVSAFVAGECAGLYIRMATGAAIGKTYKVTAHRGLANLQCNDELTSLASQGVAAADTFTMFRSSGSVVYTNPIGDAGTPPQRYMRIRFTDADTAEGDHRLGTIVAGVKLAISVPLDWAHTNNQQANVTTYRSRGAVRWSFPEGPKQRTIIGRVVGDASRWRDRMRYVLGQIDFEARPCVLVQDTERPDLAILGRVTSGSQQDNAAWYKDSTTVLRTAGDQSIAFEEEV